MMWVILVAILFLLAITQSGDAVYRYSDSQKVIAQYWATIQYYAGIRSVPPERIAAIVVQESSGDPNATGPNGIDRGLMQMTPGALADVNLSAALGIDWSDLFDPDKNINAGTTFFSMKLAEMGSLHDATRAYNVGAGAAKADPNAGALYAASVERIESTIKSIITA